jgi:antitoxin PrlF
MRVELVRNIHYIVIDIGDSQVAVTLEEISTITAKGQTTVPKAVRQALGVDYGGRIAFRVDRRGVTVSRADEAEDPAIETFLGFLASDLKARPEAVKAMPADLAARIAALTGDIPVILDGEIDGDVVL